MRDARESFPIPTDNPLQMLQVLEALEVLQVLQLLEVLEVLQWPLLAADAAGLATCPAPYLP